MRSIGLPQPHGARVPPQATYDPSHGYSPQPVDLSGVTLSRELQVSVPMCVSPAMPPPLPPHQLRPPSHLIVSPPQAMAEQLAENYHNTWGRKKKQELEAKGEHPPCPPTIWAPQGSGQTPTPPPPKWMHTHGCCPTTLRGLSFSLHPPRVLPPWVVLSPCFPPMGGLLSPTPPMAADGGSRGGLAPPARALRHLDGQGEGTGPREGAGAPQVPAAQWLRRHPVGGGMGGGPRHLGRGAGDKGAGWSG